jgi:hypothetical protein
VYLGDRIKELLSANQWSGSDTPEFWANTHVAKV